MNMTRRRKWKKSSRMNIKIGYTYKYTHMYTCSMRYEGKTSWKFRSRQNSYKFFYIIIKNVYTQYSYSSTFYTLVSAPLIESCLSSIHGNEKETWWKRYYIFRRIIFYIHCFFIKKNCLQLFLNLVNYV